MTQVDEVRGGGSYNSRHDWRLHFGLGSEAKITQLGVRWPSGLTQEFHDVVSDAIYEIKEGQEIRKTGVLNSHVH
jgi:enediyne biosynthesis protein E4